MPDTILVTGASGLLGANFVLTAKKRCGNIVALCYPYLLNFPGVKAIEVDLTNSKIARELIRDCQPDWIVHCAALTNVDWCETHRDQTWVGNVEMTRYLATVARDVNAGLVYISTDSVFDGKIGGYSEESPPAPLNVYAESKLAGEKAVRKELDHSLIVRTNIYGWNAQDKMSLAEWMLDRLEAGQTLPGFYDIVFTPILVNHLSEVVLDMIELKLRGIYHVAGSQSCSKYEFALQLAGVFGLNKDLIQSVTGANSVDLKALRPRNTSLRTNKIKEALSRPMPDVEAGLQHFKALRDSGFVRQLKALREG
jgi:dTDP-4-dehydrorhamnose reductase